MDNSTAGGYSSQPARYLVKVKGNIRENLSDWLGGLEISTEIGGDGSPITTLIGVVADQAALRGILCRIWDLNLTVLSVYRIGVDAEKNEREQNEQKYPVF